MKKRTGDTLVEVTIAVGIFSMVAISVIAVMSGSVSSAQTALETTLTREEIDAQAEAIRFINSAYLADESSGEEVYARLWNTITDNALIPNVSTNASAVMQILGQPPTTCVSPAEDTNLRQYAFVIDTRLLGNLDSGNFINAYIPALRSGTANTQFQTASTYPHLIYSNNEGGESLTARRGNLFSVEGIYVVAVKDGETTKIAKNDGSDTESKSAYYDFYIRTCWYGSNGETPSSIATVIRLYDPATFLKPPSP